MLNFPPLPSLLLTNIGVMSTHHNLNVNCRISADSWYPANMVHGQRSTILGACPLYRKSECYSPAWLFGLLTLCCICSRHLRANGVSQLTTAGSDLQSLMPFLSGRAAVVPLLKGVPVVILPKFTPEAFFKTIDTHRITHAFVVPPMILHLANNPSAEKFDLSALKWMRCAAAPLGRGLIKKVKSRLGDDVHITQGYGKRSIDSLAVGIA